MSILKTSIEKDIVEDIVKQLVHFLDHEVGNTTVDRDDILRKIIDDGACKIIDRCFEHID